MSYRAAAVSTFTLADEDRDVHNAPIQVAVVRTASRGGVVWSSGSAEMSLLSSMRSYVTITFKFGFFVEDESQAVVKYLE